MYYHNSGYANGRSDRAEPQRRSITAILGTNHVLSSRPKASIFVPQPRGVDMFNSSSARTTLSNNLLNNTSTNKPLPNSSSPFIQIPTNQMYDLNESRRDSSLRLDYRKKSEFSSIITGFSNHGHDISEINEILVKIKATKYEFSTTSFVDSKNESNSELNPDDIETIVYFVSQPGVVQKFDSKTVEKIMYIARKNTFRTISEIPKSVLYSDSYAPIYVSNWNILFYFHKLVSSIINYFDDEVVDSWIDESFMINLVNLLNSSDPNEQTSIVLLIEQIFETFENKKEFLFNRITKIIMSHNEGVNSFVCVPPSLKFFTYYFSQFKGFFNASYYNLFKLVIFQLFTTDFVHNYYTILCSLCQIFYQQDYNMATWALKFLLNHWPLSNSMKHTIYLHHSRILSNFLQSRNSDPLVIQLFQQIGRSLQSSNFKVANAALQVVGNANFLFNFSPLFPSVIPPLLKKLESLNEHWSPDVRELTKNVLQVMQPIQEGMKTGNIVATSSQPQNRRGRRIMSVLSDEKTVNSRQNASIANSNSSGSVSAQLSVALKPESPIDKTQRNWMFIYQSAIAIDVSLMTDVIPEKIKLID